MIGEGETSRLPFFSLTSHTSFWLFGTLFMFLRTRLNQAKIETRATKINNDFCISYPSNCLPSFVRSGIETTRFQSYTFPHYIKTIVKEWRRERFLLQRGNTEEPVCFPRTSSLAVLFDGWLSWCPRFNLTLLSLLVNVI